MFHSIIDAKWLTSFGLKVARVVLFQTLIIIALTIVSQFSAILASFLPLKVIILLGSENVPRYIPDFLAVYGKDILVVAFSIATLLFFLTHLLFEKIIGWFTRRATIQLLTRSQKLFLFENQDEVAKSAYLRFSRSVSGLALYFLGVLSLIFVYPLMATVVLVYPIMTGILLHFLWNANHHGFRLNFQEKAPAFFRTASGIGFFAVFGFMVVDFIIAPSPDVIPAIVSILLSRIMLQKFFGSWLDMMYLTRNRPKLQALFFHGASLQRQAPADGGRSVWSLLDSSLIASVDIIMEQVKDDWVGCRSVSWRQTGIPDVVGLEVRDELGSLYLVKIYGKRRTGMMTHECALMRGAVAGLPAPEYVGSAVIKEFKCIAYQTDAFRSLNREESKQIPEWVRGTLFGIEVPAHLVRSYARSHPLLSDRLSPKLVEDLARCALDADIRHSVELFSSILSSLKQFVASLPVTLTSGDLNSSSAVLSEKTEQLNILNWGRWGVDSIGAGWRYQGERIEALHSYLIKAKRTRPSLETINTGDVELVAMLSALESLCLRCLYGDALALLPEILERAAQLDIRPADCLSDSKGSFQL